MVLSDFKSAVPGNILFRVTHFLKEMDLYKREDIYLCRAVICKQWTYFRANPFLKYISWTDWDHVYWLNSSLPPDYCTMASLMHSDSLEGTMENFRRPPSFSQRRAMSSQKYTPFLMQTCHKSQDCAHTCCSPHGLVLQPALVLKVKLLQILQRNVLLLFSASQVQPL